MPFPDVADDATHIWPIQFLHDIKGFMEAVGQIPKVEVGLGAGIHLKEAKVGPLKAGGGVVFASGGVNVDASGLGVWGKSTADLQLSIFRYGGRIYLWDVDIDTNSPGSSPVRNVDFLGGEPAAWDWSIGVSGTYSPYSFGFELDFQPLVDYFQSD